MYTRTLRRTNGEKLAMEINKEEAARCIDEYKFVRVGSGGVYDSIYVAARSLGTKHVVTSSGTLDTSHVRPFIVEVGGAFFIAYGIYDTDYPSIALTEFPEELLKATGAIQ